MRSRLIIFVVWICGYRDIDIPPKNPKQPTHLTGWNFHFIALKFSQCVTSKWSEISTNWFWACNQIICRSTCIFRGTHLPTQLKYHRHRNAFELLMHKQDTFAYFNECVPHHSHDLFIIFRTRCTLRIAHKQQRKTAEITIRIPLRCRQVSYLSKFIRNDNMHTAHYLRKYSQPAVCTFPTHREGTKGWGRSVYPK